MSLDGDTVVHADADKDTPTVRLDEPDCEELAVTLGLAVSVTVSADEPVPEVDAHDEMLATGVDDSVASADDDTERTFVGLTEPLTDSEVVKIAVADTVSVTALDAEYDDGAEADTDPEADAEMDASADAETEAMKDALGEPLTDMRGVELTAADPVTVVSLDADTVEDAASVAEVAVEGDAVVIGDAELEVATVTLGEPLPESDGEVLRDGESVADSALDTVPQREVVTVTEPAPEGVADVCADAEPEFASETLGDPLADLSGDSLTCGEVVVDAAPVGDVEYDAALDSESAADCDAVAPVDAEILAVPDTLNMPLTETEGDALKGADMVAVATTEAVSVVTADAEPE
jgi:hypothetical protein